MRQSRADGSEGVLVDLPNWVGDVVLTLPALARIREGFPRQGVIALAPTRFLPLLRGVGVVAEARPDRAGFLWGRRRLGGRFRIAITARHSTRAKLLLAGAGARRALASRGRGARALGLEPFAVDRGRHQRYDLDAALERLGCTPVDGAFAPLALPEDLVRQARSRLDALVGAVRPVALLPATGSGEEKRYPAEGYRAVVHGLSRAGHAALVVVGPGEEAVGGAAAAGAPVVPSDWPLEVVAAVLSCCHAAVGNDSGLTHLAAALACPTVALFGPTDPARTGPSGRVFVIRAEGGTMSAGNPSPAAVVRAVMGVSAGGCAGGPVRVSSGAGWAASSTGRARDS